MTDVFAKTLLDAIQKLDEKISAAEQRMLSDQQLIDECSYERATFRTLLEAYLEKKKADSEALATLYASGKTFADFKTFSSKTGTDLPVELDDEPDSDD